MTNRLDLPDVTWRRVSPKYVLIDLAGAAVVTVLFVVAATIPVFATHLAILWFVPAVVLVVMIVVLAFIPRRVRAIGYQLRDDDLLFRRGLLFQRFVAVPYGRMQLVDITRGPMSRVLGLSELRFVTAASSSGVVIPGLLVADAEALRDHLVAVAETRRAGL